MTQYKYELATELLQYLERYIENSHSLSPYDDTTFNAFEKFPDFVDPSKAWDFLRRADFFGSTLPLLLDLENKPTTILDWARYIKSRDGFALVASSITVGEAIADLQDLIYALAHGEQL